MGYSLTGIPMRLQLSKARDIVREPVEVHEGRDQGAVVTREQIDVPAKLLPADNSASMLTATGEALRSNDCHRDDLKSQVVKVWDESSIGERFLGLTLD